MYRKAAATETRKPKHCSLMYKHDICTVSSRDKQTLHGMAPQKLINHVLSEPYVGELHMQRIIHLHISMHLRMTLPNIHENESKTAETHGV